MNYRLGLDLGTNSIGWAMIKLSEQNEPVNLIKMGSRIFHDGRNEKNKVPLAAQRREARGIRRNLDRTKQRKNSLILFLIENNIMPENENERKNLANLDPYELRFNAANQKIPLYHLGRILMHISSRRGFKSNRKENTKADENGKISTGIKRLNETLQVNNCKTLGQYLFTSKQNGDSVRCRLGLVNNKKGYDKYVERKMLENEFLTIFELQKKFHEELTNEISDKIFHIIFDQRPLKPQTVGRCSIKRDEERLSRAHVVSQDFILLQKINDLKVWISNEFAERQLTNEEKNILKNELKYRKEITYEAIRKLFYKNIISAGGQIDYGNFSHEKKSTDKLEGNHTNALMVDKKRFGSKWAEISENEQFNILETLLSSKTDEEVTKYLINNFQISLENAQNIMESKLKLGYMRYGKTVLSTLVKIMDEKNIDKYSAENEAGYFETDDRTCMERLPYYAVPLETHVVPGTGEVDAIDETKYGKIANPTVHIALNQLRKLVNELVDFYGKPTQIVVEIGRELKLSKENKEKIEKLNKENQEKNQKFRDELNSLGLVCNADNMLRMKLWNEMPAGNRVCVYSGKQISLTDLFSSAINIDHILPFSRTLDDGFSNKVLCYRSANAFKTNKTPYEAFKDSPSGYNYHEILQRGLQVFNGNKKEKFSPEAMNKYEENRDFIARQLTDMQYISRIAAKYLRVILEDENSLWVTPGRLTSMLRGKLGLNNIISLSAEKNRNDHRHHAIDALVVALTSRSLLQRISSSAYVEEEKGSERILSKLEYPWEKFHENVKRAVSEIRVSFKQDHGTEGQLHEDTAYGIVKNYDFDLGNLVRRKFIEDIEDFKSIRDKTIRDKLDQFPTKEEKLVYLKNRGIRRLRLLKQDSPIIPVKNRSGEVYKAFVAGSNLCLEVYEEENGKKGFEVIRLFDANQKGFKPKWMAEKPNAKLLFRLFKNDILKLGKDERNNESDRDEPNYVKITSIKQGELVLLPVNEAGSIKDREKKEGQIYIYKSFNPLFNKIKAIPFNISITGKVSKGRFASINFWDK